MGSQIRPQGARGGVLAGTAILDCSHHRLSGRWCCPDATGSPPAQGILSWGLRAWLSPPDGRRPAADRLASLITRGCGAVEVQVEAGNFLRKAGVSSLQPRRWRAGGTWGERNPPVLLPACHLSPRRLAGNRGIYAARQGERGVSWFQL